MVIIACCVTLLIAIFRFIIPIKEKNIKSEIQRLENRINQLKNEGQIKFAKEARNFENELMLLNRKLRGYPNIIYVLNFMVMISAAITLIFALMEK